MNRSAFLGFVALFSTALALPASAAYVRIGSVDVGFRTDRVAQWNRFGGHMEGLRLVADGNDVWCRSIVAHFANGGSQNVYSGMLREDRPLYVDLKGGTRLVSDVTFTCRSNRRGGAKIHLAAEVGRYQNEWRNSPGWATFWSRIFRWGPQSGYDANYWVTLGRERFEGRNDRETTFAGWGGRSVERIGLRAVDDDARCSRVRVAFGNGDVKVYDVGRLDMGRMRTIDLPGGNRNVRNINLVCHAAHGRAVTIEIMARK